MTCRELVELVTGYLEGALTPKEREGVEAHLQKCGGCSEYVEQMRQTIQLTGKLGEDDVPPDARETLLAAFRDWRAAR
jgi:anti-sigma factor RsiW